MSTQLFVAEAQAAAKTLPYKPWDYSKLREVDGDAKSTRLVVTTSPLGKQTKIKFVLSRIANVYSTLASNTVPVLAQSINHEGQTLFVEVNTTAEADEAVNATTTKKVIIPMVARIELRIPSHDAIDEQSINDLIGMLYASLCNGTGASILTTEKLRGALAPSGV